MGVNADCPKFNDFIKKLGFNSKYCRYENREFQKLFKAKESSLMFLPCDKDRTNGKEEILEKNREEFYDDFRKRNNY